MVRILYNLEDKNGNRHIVSLIAPTRIHIVLKGFRIQIKKQG